MVEQVRYHLKNKGLHAFFTFFCDEREQNHDSPIVTHLYLLLGCGLPITLSFIIFDGGFFNGEFATLAFSGIVFLGVGDVTAALYGRAYGVQKWYKGTSKS
jgi:dolichol kinase